MISANILICAFTIDIGILSTLPLCHAHVNSVMKRITVTNIPYNFSSYSVTKTGGAPDEDVDQVQQQQPHLPLLLPLLQPSQHKVGLLFPQLLSARALRAQLRATKGNFTLKFPFLTCESVHTYHGNDNTHRQESRKNFMQFPEFDAVTLYLTRVSVCSSCILTSGSATGALSSGRYCSTSAMPSRSSSSYLRSVMKAFYYGISVLTNLPKVLQATLTETLRFLIISHMLTVKRMINDIH